MIPTVQPPAPSRADHDQTVPAAPRRPRAGLRARWLAARARNAARHGLLIAAVGALVVIAALLLFVLVPHQVDRAIAIQIAALPPERDTLSLHVDALSARRQLTRLDASIAAAAIAARADATVPQAVIAPLDSVTVATVPITGDSAANDLLRQLLRVRQAPLVESYRALADTRLLREDARVRSMIDSLEQLHAEREAYAALSGPDARYASMTARLTQLGQRLARLAEVAYAGAAAMKAESNPVTAIDSVVASPLLVVQQPMADSALERSRAAAADTLARIDRALLDAAALNADLRAKRDALRARMQLDIPPMAMLLASLVLGLALGFAVALWRELRRPTVGDEQELEALTGTRVIVHRATTASIRATRARRRSDEQLAPVIQPTDAAWPLLHLTLTSIGDVSRYVEVVADQPVLAGAVALNLSAVAAHESRATVLVDAARRSGVLPSLLPFTVLTAASTTSAVADASVHERWDAPRALAIGRDTFIDIVLPRRVRSRQAGHEPATAPDAVSAMDDLQRLAAHHDLAVYITDHDLDQQVPSETDVVLCARPGVTTLAWLSLTMRQLEDRGRRVRAVVLWSADLPLTG